MKVAVVKLGGRITINSSGKTCISSEAVSIINVLLRAGVEVDAYTKVISKDEKPTGFNIFNIDDTYEDVNNRGYDALLIINGKTNYYGGEDLPYQTHTYYMINSFKGSVFYVLCDVYLPFQQVWPRIEKKKWSDLYEKDKVVVTRDDIKYITEARLLHKVVPMAHGKNNDIKIKDTLFFPLDKFPLLSLSDNEFDYDTEKEYDLFYSGTFREGRRAEDMIKYLYGYDDKYKIAVSGGIEESDFSKYKIDNLRAPEFLQPCDYNGYINRLERSIATPIIGDKLYKQLNLLPMRTYESIMSGLVVLMDSNYDYTKRTFNSEELKKFNYVSSRKDVEERIEQLRDKEFRNHILKLQLEDVKIDLDEYCNSFRKLLEENM